MGRLFGLLFLGILLAPLCWAGEPSLRKVSLQLHWKHEFEFAGFYAAKEQGYYKAAGLEVDFYESDDHTDVIREVLENRKTFSIAGGHAVSDRLNGFPIVMLSNYFKRSPLALVTRPDIVLPSDLKGKRVMVPMRDLNGIAFQSMFRKFYVRNEDMTIVPHTFNTDDFIKGKVDAMSVFLTHEPYHLQRLKVPYNVIDPGNYGAEFYDINLITSESFARQNPELVRAFKQASDRGWAYALSHQAEIVDLILRKYNTQHDTRQGLLFEAEHTEKIMMPKIYPIGSIEHDKVRRMADLYIQSGEARSLEPLKGFVFDAVEVVENTYPRITLSAAERHYLSGKGTIRMCSLLHFPPFDYVNENGDLDGIAPEILAKLEPLLETKFVWHRTRSWSESLAALGKGECDLMPVLTDVPERHDTIRFTRPWSVEPMVIATRVSELFVQDLADLRGRQLGIDGGNPATMKYRRLHPELKLVPVDGPERALELVRKGELWGYIDSMPVIGFYLQKHAMVDLKIAGKAEFNLETSIATRADEPLLASIMQKAADAVPPQEMRTLLSKRLTVRVEQGFDYALFKKLGLGVAFFFLCFLLWNRRLAKYNAALKLAQAETAAALDNLKQTQAQLIQQEKLASLGQLVANVAHEINTPISAIHSSGHNIVAALDQVLHTLPQLSRSLSEQDAEAFLFLLALLQRPALLLSSREERSAIRELAAQLEARGLANANRHAATLVQCRVKEADLDAILPVLRSARCAEILKAAHNVAGALDNSANINVAVESVSRIVFALKSFSRQDDPNTPVTIKLRESLDTVLTLYQSKIRRGVELVKHYADVPDLLGYPGDLSQVWTNLVHNALHAMGSHGVLTVGLREHDGWVLVEISDSGCGIAPDILERIFDPFFTTKPMGEGSGLGLGIVRKILEKHHGRINVKSAVGKGTTFTVHLPCVRPNLATTP